MLKAFKGKFLSLKYWLKSPHFRRLYNSHAIDADVYYKINHLNSPHPISPIAHWMAQGYIEDRNPTPWFKSKWYTQTYRLDEKADPLLHFIETGWAQNLKPNALFATQYFKSDDSKQRDDASKLSDKKFQGRHFRRSWPTARNPNPFFDAQFYMRQNKQVLSPIDDPLIHYMENGFDQAFRPDGFFDLAFYNEANPCAAELGIPQLLHYVEHGAGERATPNRFFDPIFYIQQRKLNISEPADVFGHYLINRDQLDLKPSKLFDPAFYAETYPDYSATHAHPLLHYQAFGVLNGYYPCARVMQLEHKPLISIVTPVFNTEAIHLKRCIHSVMNQAYPHWELCLVDDASTRPEIKQQLHRYQALDPRIKLCFLENNLGISGASRAALSMATGEYVGFLDHDDELQLSSLYEVVRAINLDQADIVYTDEELINEEHKYLETIYKPAYNPELLLNHNYINHFLVARRSLIDKISPFGEGTDGAQDHDFLLRLAEKTDNICHISKSLYRWRVSETSTSANSDQKPYAQKAGMSVIRSALARRQIKAKVKKGHFNFYYDIHRKIRNTPSVDVIIVGSKSLLTTPMQLNSILRKSTWDNVRYHLIAHSKAADFKGIKQLAGTQPLLHDLSGVSCVAERITRIGLQSNADYLAILGPNIVPNEDGWIEKFLAYFQYDNVAIVGGKVFYGPQEKFGDRWFAAPDLDNKALEYYKAFLMNGSKTLFGHEASQRVSYVASEFCMLDRKQFETCKGFDYASFPEYLYDMDLSLALSSKDLQLVYTSLCSAEHLNSKALGQEKMLQNEKVIFQSKWKDKLASGDPYHNLSYLLNQTRVTHKQWLAWYAGIQ